MNRFKNIGVIFQLAYSNADVLAHARELIQTNQATIHLLCIAPHDLTSEQMNKIEKTLRDKLSVDFTLHYVTETPIVDITRYSIEKKLDLILVGAEQNESALNRFFYGSLTLSLMRKTPCPIWVAKSPGSATYQRVMIAVDPVTEGSDEVAAGLNDKLIEIGTSYAKRQGAECYLVTAWRIEGEGMLQGPFLETPPEVMQKMKDEEKAECAQAFEQLQKRHQAILKGCETHMLHGEPGVVIPQFVVDNHIDLVVMGTVARTGIQGFIIGNTAETIINQIDCSIITIKPDGFVSPIAS